MTLWLKTKIYQHLPALKSRNFRLFFTGQTMSLSGTFMTQVTISWVIYDLTKSSWLLGLTGFLQFLPTVLLTPFSGVLCDRWNQKKLLILVQILGLMVSTTLTTLTFIGGSGMLQVSCGNTIIQTLVEDDKRGRVMSLYSLAIIGTLPLGNLIVGSLAQNIGAPNTVIGCGIFCLLESIWFNQQLPLLRGKIRETLILSTSTLETGA
ncbi:MFS transporter [Cylindrospermopsis sp. CR12]|uniref:MFS transporter n=1 Tax=Cylindrospermopsis sp. CR12 TaxID=1747196 RepID=UPI00092EC6CD|nr:MFS transporter [Cylindrospermopsis sp. CR12]